MTDHHEKVEVPKGYPLRIICDFVKISEGNFFKPKNFARWFISKSILEFEILPELFKVGQVSLYRFSLAKCEIDKPCLSISLLSIARLTRTLSA